MIIHKPQSNVYCTMIKVTATENDMEEGTEMLYTETNCFVKLKQKETAEKCLSLGKWIVEFIMPKEVRHHYSE